MSVRVTAAPDIGDVDAHTDLPAVIAEALQVVPWDDGSHGLTDGDIVVITSKVVSKAEGRVVAVRDAADRERVIDAESVHVLARRGSTRIVRTHHGLVLAAAGVDESNTVPGTLVLLPVDPDASARRLRAALQHRLGHRLAVVITDSMGRAWRMGITEHAIGVAGLEPVTDLRGTRDHTGRALERTVVATADQVAAAAGLVVRKDARQPVVVVRGLSALVSEDDGPGAAALVRPVDEDLFREGRIEP